jgi:hypothetical protein
MTNETNVEQWVKINVNDNIRVKLLDEGYQILADDHNQFLGRIPNWESRDAAYYKSKADKDGYTTFQMWEFMQKFGPLIKMGRKVHFEMDIILRVALSRQGDETAQGERFWWNDKGERVYPNHTKYDANVRIDEKWLLEQGWHKDGDWFVKGEFTATLSSNKRHPRPYWFVSTGLASKGGFSAYFDMRYDLNMFIASRTAEQKGEEWGYLEDSPLWNSIIDKHKSRITALEAENKRLREGKINLAGVYRSKNKNRDCQPVKVGAICDFPYCNCESLPPAPVNNYKKEEV